MKSKYLIELSSIIDKMDIKKELQAIDKSTKEELGTAILVLLVTNLHKAEDEFYNFIMDYKNIDLEQAKDYDAIELFKEVLNINGVVDFLK